MAHLPFFKFYPNDWIRDVQVLSMEARGAYITLLCDLHFSETRGKKSYTIREISNLLTCFGGQDDQWQLWLYELDSVMDIETRDEDQNLTETFDNAAEITITSRRMVRDEAERIQGLEYDRTYREKKTSSKRKKTSDINQKSEVRYQISEEDINTSSVELENSSSHGDGAIKPFPYEFLWIKELVEMQSGGFPKERFMDFAWWEAVSFTCGGLSQAFLEREFAGIRRWVMDNPQRVPTPRGYRRFVAGWLERAHDKERRFPNGNQATRRR